MSEYTEQQLLEIIEQQQLNQQKLYERLAKAEGKLNNKSITDNERKQSQYKTVTQIVNEMETFQDTEGALYGTTTNNVIVTLDGIEMEKDIYNKYDRLTHTHLNDTTFKLIFRLLTHKATSSESRLSKFRTYYDEINNLVYLDTGFENKCLQISCDGITTMNWPREVLFYRGDRTQVLNEYNDKATPNDMLRPWLEFPEDIAHLIAAWSIKALLPIGDNVHLVLYGKSGSGKSTIAKVLTSLIDPRSNDMGDSEIELPETTKDLATQCLSDYILTYGNVDPLTKTVSNHFSRFSTGGGVKVQRYYQQGKQFSVIGKRVVIINSVEYPIKDTATDLPGRCLAIKLPSWDEDKDLPEPDILWAEYKRYEPNVLGATYNAIKVSLRHLERVRRHVKGRLNSLCQVGEASQLWEPGALTTLVNSKITQSRITFLGREEIAEAIKNICRDSVNRLTPKLYGWWARNISMQVDGDSRVTGPSLSRWINNKEDFLADLGIYVMEGDKRTEGQYVTIVYCPQKDQSLNTIDYEGEEEKYLPPRQHDNTKCTTDCFKTLGDTRGICGWEWVTNIKNIREKHGE